MYIMYYVQYVCMYVYTGRRRMYNTAIYLELTIKQECIFCNCIFELACVYITVYRYREICLNNY